MKKLLVSVLVVLAALFATPVFAGNQTLEFRLTAPGHNVSYAFVMVEDKAIAEAGKPDSEVIIGQPVKLVPKIVFAPGSYEVLFTFKDGDLGQYLTGSDRLVQNWPFELRIGLLKLDQDCGVWKDNGLGGGNLSFQIQVNADGSVVKQ
jgi:hypothetical protein